MSGIALSGFELRPMADEDLNAIVPIEAEGHPFPWSRGNFADSLAAGHSAWSAFLDERLIGYLVFQVVVDEAHLLNITVAASHRGTGYGARLLRQTMTLAQGNGATSLLLEVRPSNIAALALYRHFGFTQIGVRRNYYPARTGREDALVLRRALDEREGEWLA